MKLSHSEYTEIINIMTALGGKKYHLDRNQKAGESSAHLYCVVEGSVQKKNGDNKDLILDIMFKGQLFRHEPEVRYEARCKSVVMALPLESANTSAWLRKTAYSQTLTHARLLQVRLAKMAYSDVQERVGDALVWLASMPDAITAPGGMQIRITRQEIGEIVGCSREMVGRVISDMHERGLIHAEGGKTMTVMSNASGYLLAA